MTERNLIEFLVALRQKGQLGLALELWQHLLKVRPPVVGIAEHLNRVSAILNDHGNELARQGKLEDALDFQNFALRASNTYAIAIMNNMASTLKDQGRLDECLEVYRRALAIKPDFDIAQSGILLTLNYHAGMTLDALIVAHRLWGQRYQAAFKTPESYPNITANPDRPLRIGFISGDFGCHPVGMLLIRYLEHVDPAQFAIICYATTRRQDALTARFRHVAIAYNIVDNFRDDDLVARIQADRIDILVDLSGHTLGNRLPIFARKPAPVQISWMGYPGYTGLPSIDYVIGDEHVLTAKAGALIGDRILRLPGTFVCFDPPPEAPAVSALPATEAGAVTFGYMGSPAKCGDQVMALWAQILARLPRARLLLKYKGFDQPSIQKRFRTQFTKLGIEPSRLEFQGDQPYREMFAAMQKIDIALDAFPFAGGLMTCLLLWMGIPVITLPGESFSSRQGLSFLTAIGAPEIIAADAEDYCTKAVDIAHDLARLDALRQSLRVKMETSILCDGRQAARGLEEILRQAWRGWCRQAEA